MEEMTERHIVKSYDEELEQLHRMVMQMGELVQEQIKRAVETLIDEDIDGAQEVIERDQLINKLDIQTDEFIIQIIARRQPMAKDLREILTVGKIVSELERMGDHVRWIARLTIRLYDDGKSPPPQQILTDIHKMAEFVDKMAQKSLRSFDTLDLDMALEVLRMNKEIEDDFRSALRRLSTFIMEDSRNVGHVVDVVLGLRALERFGGHAKNIAGHIIFLVKGRDVRHEELPVVAMELQR